MKVVSTTKTRKYLSEMISDVAENQSTYVIGRRDKPEALLVPYPKALQKGLSEITIFNMNSRSFDFLKDEPDIYSVDDIKVARK